MGSIHQHVHAGDADQGYEGNPDAAEDEARIPDGHGQGEDANSNVSFEYMNGCFEVPDAMEEMV